MAPCVPAEGFFDARPLAPGNERLMRIYAFCSSQARKDKLVLPMQALVIDELPGNRRKGNTHDLASFMLALFENRFGLAADIAPAQRADIAEAQPCKAREQKAPPYFVGKLAFYWRIVEPLDLLDS